MRYILVIISFLSFLATVCTASSASSPEIKEETAPLRLTLSQAIELALSKNRNLRSSYYSIQSQEFSLAATESAFDVKVSPVGEVGIESSADEESSWSAGGTIRKKFTTGIEFGLSPSVGKGENDFSAALNFKLDVPLFRGWGEAKALDPVYSSRFALSEANYSLRLAQVNLVLETVQVVYEVIGQQEIIRIIQEQLGPLQEYLIVTKVKEKAGIVSQMDVYRSELRIKGEQANLASAQEQEKNSSDRLKQVLALPLEKKLLIQAPISYEEVEADLPSFIQIAMENRLEVKRKRDSIVEKKRKQKLAEHNLQPDLKLIAGYNRLGYSDTFGDSFRFDEGLWSVRLSSTTDLARSEEHAAYEQSRILVRQEELGFQTVRENIVQEIRMRLNGLEKAKQRITINQGQINDALGKLKLADIKFRFGEADNFDLVQAQSELQQARIGLVGEKIRYILESYRLRAALGTLIAW